jgi:exonuclease SbcD
MKILHTSDWHLGRTLFGRKRYDEFEACLDWLAGAIRREQVDAFLIAGDVFDTSTPSNRAQEMYYRMLCKVAGSACRHVVVVAGNHDSPSFLAAPRELLRAINVHVVGAVNGNPDDEVLLLRDSQGEVELIVCAVPYLRDRDIRTAQAGETIAEKECNLAAGICGHYQAVCAAAEEKRRQSGLRVPIVAMGHLFTARGQTVDGDGVRELYIGSLAHVAADIFPECIDYLALGHLHMAQKVAGRDHMRYSGAPLAMGFADAGQTKSVCLVEFEERQAAVAQIEVPVFQQLERVAGDWKAISGRLRELAATGSPAWLEVVYEGEEVIADLRERLEAAAADTGLEILRVKNNRIIDRVLQQMDTTETLDDLNAHDVFERCLTAHSVCDEQRPELLQAYREALASLYEGFDPAE